MPDKPMKNRQRLAYSTAFQVAWSYIWLNLKSKVLGAAYKRRKLPELHERNALKVKSTLLELQGLFVKFGQLVSILANILPEAFRAPLASLQDKIPARPYAEVLQTFTVSTGKRPEDVFDNFDKTPIAAASIGQVHLAKKAGITYAVKIQHIDIEAITVEDLKILKNLLIIYSWFMDIKGTGYLYAQMKEMIEQELDYTKESESMRKIAENIRQQPTLNIIVPEVHTKLSNRKVLVTTFFDGKNIANLSQLDAWKIDPQSVAERVLLLFSAMILNDGYYHADPHPGNFLINKEGQIALLDFGAVATLDEGLRLAIPKLIEAVITNDTDETISALHKMGFLVSGAESQRIAERLIKIGRRFIEEEIELDGLDFSSIKLKSGTAAIVKLFREINFQELSSAIQIPKDYILLYRTIMLLFGMSFQLAPKYNPIDTIRPFIQEHQFSKSISIHNTVIHAIKKQLAIAIGLPNAVDSFLKKANNDELEVKLHNFDKNIQKIYYLGQQFLFMLVGIFSYYMADSGSGDIFYWFAGLSVFLFLRVWWLGKF